MSVWTWHNDIGRTGQNASETSLTPTSVIKTGFGQLCSYAVDGQVYAQPLVLANATVLGTHHSSVVYVATQNDSVYLLDGTNCGFIASAVTGTSTSLIPSGESAVDCHDIGGMNCGIIAPKVGILGTPVIDENTNHIYLVTYSTDGTSYYHRLHALFTGLVSGTTPLAEDASYNSPQVVSSGSFSPVFSSLLHIQRPGLLLLPGTEAARPQIYIGFSMMDGLTTFPPGFIFRYYGDDLSQAPLVYTTEPTTGKAGGGVWMDGAGLAAGIDSSGGNTYLYVTTADGDFDPLSSTLPCTDCGDSFVKLTAALGVSSSFTPADEACRFINNHLTNPDLDFGSGGVMLIPDTLLTSWPYVAISADKNQHIWAMPRSSPGFYNGGSTCTNGSNANLETVAGTGVYHNTPAFWQSGPSTGYLYYSSIGGAISQYPVQSTTCTSGTAPICNAINTSSDPTGASHAFFTGTTPSISSNGTSNGIVWALDGPSVQGTSNGALWAFNASNMHHLYNSTQCPTRDSIFSATQFSVPTIANGYVYVGAQANNNTGSPTKGQGTFYIFGLTSATCN